MNLLRRLWCVIWGHTWEAPYAPGMLGPRGDDWACACCGRPGRVVWMCDGSRDRDGRWVVQKVVREG